MLRTSSQEGGLQQRTESPKATSGAPNGFVRPVAVASIFRPALGGSSGVSDVDGKPAVVPEKRRSSAAKETKTFGSALSSEEFTRRRQSFDAKNALLLKQVKGNRSSPSRTLPNSESLPEYTDEESADEKCSKKCVRSENNSVIQNVVAKNLKDDSSPRESSAAVKPSVVTRKENLNIEEKEKNSKNLSHLKSARSNKTSLPPPESKVPSKSEDNVPVVQNGILEENEIPVVEPRSRSRNTGRVTDCVESAPAPYTERRRRNKVTQNTSVDKESVSLTSSDLGSTKAETIGNVPSPRSGVTGDGTDRIFSEVTSKNRGVPSTESVTPLHHERRRRDKISQDTSIEQNLHLNSTRVAEKDQASQKVCEPNTNPVSSSASQTKSGGHQVDANAALQNSDEKRDSVEALDSQSVSKFRTCRRTSDVIAARIQTIFSKSDKPVTLPSSSKSASTKAKLGSEKEPKSAVTELDSVVSQVVPQQKAAEEKVLGRKEGSSANSSSSVGDPVRPPPGGVGQVSKPDSANIKKQDVKYSYKVETTTTTENKSNTNTVVNSNFSRSSFSSEKSAEKSLVKDNKFNSLQKDSSPLTVRIAVASGVGSEKKCEKSDSVVNSVFTKKEVSATVKGLTSSAINEEKSAPPRKPSPSINFFITEVSVENSPQPQKSNTGKVSPLQLYKVTTQTVEEKSCDIRKADAKKNASDNFKAKNSTTETINSSVSVTKRSDKGNADKTSQLKEECKVPPTNEQQKSNQTHKPVAEENNSTKTPNVSKSEFKSRSVVLKSSEKDKVGRSLPLKEENKLLPENLQKTAVKPSTEKSIASDAKCQSSPSSEPASTESQVLKPWEKNKAVKSLPPKDSSKVGPEAVIPKSNQILKTSAEFSASKDTKVLSTGGNLNSGTGTLKPSSEKADNLKDKSLPLKDGEKVEVEKFQQKSSQAQKADAEGNRGRELKPSEKDKGKYLSLKENNKILYGNSLQKSGQTQKLDAPTTVTSSNSKSQITSSNLKSHIISSDSKSQIVSSDSKFQIISDSKSQIISDSKSQITSSDSKSQIISDPKSQIISDSKSQIIRDSKSQITSSDLKSQITSGNLKSQITSSDSKFQIIRDSKSQITSSCESLSSRTSALKPTEKGKPDKALPSKESAKVSPENLEQKCDQVKKLVLEENTLIDTKPQNLTTPDSGAAVLKQSDKDKLNKGLQLKGSRAVSESLNKRSDLFQKWSEKESAAVKGKNLSSNNATVPPKQTCNTTGKSSVQKSESEMPSENLKQKLGPEESPGSKIESVILNIESVNSSKVQSNKQQQVEIKAKPPTSGSVCKSEQPNKEEKVCSKVKNFEKPDEVSKNVEVKEISSSVVVCAQTEDTAANKSVQVTKKAETARLVLNSKSPTTKRSEKRGSTESLTKKGKHISMQPQDSPELAVGSAPKQMSEDSSTKDVSGVRRDAVETSVSSKVDKVDSSNARELNAVLANSVTPVAEREVKDTKMSQENICHPGSKMLDDKLRKIPSEASVMEKLLDADDYGIFAGMPPIKEDSNSVNRFSYPPRSSSFSKFETPKPPERKRSGFFREISTLTSPSPRAPLRSVTRTGSLKYPDDSSRLSMERSFSVLRSSSQSILGPSYTPQRITYTEMLSKLGTCGLNPPSTSSNRKFGTSQVSELWADLGEEQANSAHTSEMLESETSERMRLEKEVQELQSRYSHMQQKSDKMEMEMMEARVYRATEVNGDLSEDEENDATVSIYKQKYERAVRDMEIMKRRLQQQHEEEIEQSLMLKKAADKRLTEALEDVEEERQVVNQWKRKAQKLGAELQDLRLMLEEQMARNGELEKKQRRFDAELSAAQEEIRKEHQLREKLTREKDQAQLEKYSLEQEIQATRLDMDMQHEKIALLNRELDELSLSSKGEEEVTQLKRAKQELERKTRDQEEELEELAGQVQMLEQAKLRLEMSLEKLRQEHRRESSVRDEEIEEIRAGSSKKIKNLEAQLENEQDERHQLVKQKHELERRVIELSDQPPPQDPEIERRLRRDLKRTKALLRDAQSMLEHVRDGQANKTLIRQLKNQLEDAEFTKSVAIKARQSSELELQELQSQLEEVTRTKNDVESRCLQLSREKSAIHAQLEEMEEEMAEIMKKYKAAVAQMSIDQKSLAEQNQQISELETERQALKDQLAEVSTKLDHISVQTEDSSRVHRLDSKVRDLESKIELEQTTRSRLEHQITRLKEQCDRSREECESLRSKELQAQEGTRRLQRQLRELREDYAALQQKESEAYRKQHELEMALENTEGDLQVTKNDLRLACQRIQDLQNALEDDLDSGTDVPDDSGSDTDSSLDISVLGRQCLTPLQRSDSVSSNTSIGSDSRQFRALSHSQDMAYFSRMMQRRTSMDFLI